MVPKRTSAASGFVCRAKAASSAGISSVSSSRARWLRVARGRPWCQLRTIAATEPGSRNPIRRKVSMVSGSSSVPVKTRLPCASRTSVAAAPDRAGASSNSPA